MDRNNKRTFEDYQIKRGNNVYKGTALGSQRTEFKTEDQCPFFQAVNDEIRRLSNEYLSDVKAHLEYYPNVQRASIYLMKIAGLSAGQRMSFDIENSPLLIMVLATAYGKFGMNLQSFETAVDLAGALSNTMKRETEAAEMEQGTIVL